MHSDTLQSPLMLTDRERDLASTIEDLPEAILITRNDLDPPGPTIVAASRGMTELTQYPVAELLGRSPREHQGSLTDRAVLDRLRRSCEAGERFVGSAVNYRRDGSPFLLEWTLEPLRDAEGTITHFFSLQRDVTGRHPFAREWLAAEARSRQVFTFLSEKMALVAEAILVLERTKHNFRSKQLGALRQRLREALDRTRKELDLDQEIEKKG